MRSVFLDTYKGYIRHCQFMASDAQRRGDGASEERWKVAQENWHALTAHWEERSGNEVKPFLRGWVKELDRLEAVATFSTELARKSEAAEARDGD